MVDIARDPEAAAAHLTAAKRELLARMLSGRAPAPVRRIPRADPSVPVRLSLAQERVWLLSQLAGEVPAFNLVMAIRSRYPVDLDLLRANVEQAFRRHDSMRMTVRMVDGEPRLHVADEIDVSVPVYDVSACTDPEAAARARVDEIAVRSFDLEQGPLWRVELVRFAADDNILVLGAHHLVSDAHSLLIVAQEIASGEPADDASVSYVDYAAYEHRRMGEGAFEDQLAYWREALADLPPPLELPADRPRPAQPDYAGATIRDELRSDVGARLLRLGKDEGTTAYVVLLTVFAVMLSKYSGQRDILIGSQVSGRSMSELQHVVGIFLNMVPIRATVRGGETFRELLRRVREATLAAYAHQDVPFESLVRELRRPGDRSQVPLVQVSFNMPVQRQAPGAREEVVPVPVTPAGSQLDLGVHVLTRPDDSADVQLEFAAALFDEATARRMLAHYLHLLDAVAKDPDTVVDNLWMLPEAERADRIEIGVGSPVEVGGCLPELISARVAASPGRIAVEDGDARLSYAQLGARAGALAGQLREHDVAPGEVVALCLPRGLDLPVAVLAAWHLGAAFLPLDPDHPPARWQALLDDARPAVLVAGGERMTAVAEVCPPGCPLVDMSAVDASTPPPPAVEVGPDDAAYLMFTSGSTGRPKGVLVTHGGIANRVCWSVREQGLTAADRLLAKTRVGFDAAVLEWTAPLVAGGTVVMAAPGVERDPAALVRALAESRASVLQGVPSVLRLLVDEPDWSGCGALRQIWLAGEPLDGALLRRLRERTGAAVWNTYGPTECAIDVTACQVLPRDVSADTLPAGAVPIGRPLENVRVAVLDRNGQPTPVNVPGELLVGGVAVARGYASRPDLTAERFVPDPFGPPGTRLYRTGDLARWRLDGVLEFVGRVDDQIKINGVRTEPAEVAAALTSHPAVRQAYVTGVRGPHGDRRLVAYVVADEATDVIELRRHLTARLPEAMLPAQFIALDRMPLNDNGKVDRAALPPAEVAVHRPEYAAPRTRTEKAVARVWQELLGVDRVGLHDEFFALGGHSLLLTRVQHRLGDALGVALPLHVLFSAMTVETLATAVDEVAAPTDHIPVVPRGGRLPLSFGQTRWWFLDRFYPGSPEYVIPLFVPLADPADPAHVRAALNVLGERHEVLRTRYTMVDGEPWQVVDATSHASLAVVAATAERLSELVGAELRRGFDLERGPVWRATLLRGADVDPVLMITMHHIASDGWSSAILEREFRQVYAAVSSGSSVELPDLPIQYLDFAAWQRDRIAGAELERQMDYWRARLADPPVLALPTDRPRPGIQEPTGARLAARIPPALAAEVVEVGRLRGATPFMTLLAAFAALLSRHSGQTDIAIGTPVAGRSHPDVDGVVGVFINTLVLRCDLSGGVGFGGLLDRVRSTALEAFAHQDVPFERLVSELQPERDLSRYPLYGALFDLHDADHAGQSLEERAGELPSVIRHDLGLTVRQQADGSMTATFQYATALFDRATIRQMSEQFVCLLEHIVAEPDVAVTRLNLLAPAQRQRMVAEQTRHAFEPPPALFLEAFHRVLCAAPNAPVTLATKNRWSYTELVARANRLAHHLRASEATSERVVAVCLDDPAQRTVAFLAVLQTGAACLVLDASGPVDRWREALADLDPLMLVTDADSAGRLLGFTTAGQILVDRDARVIAACPATPLALAVHPEQIAFTTYPGGLQIPHRAVLPNLSSGALPVELAAICDAGEIGDRVRRVLDPDGQPVPVGVVGELFIAGSAVARGYRNRPGRTAEHFVPDPYGPPGGRMFRTGHPSRVRANGSVEVLDLELLRRSATAANADRLTAHGSLVAPRTVAEKRIADIWSDLLGTRTRIGVHHSFFQLGGHSLLAVRLTARIGEAFDIDLPLQAVFETPTIAGLAQLVEEMIRAEVESLTDSQITAEIAQPDSL